MELRHLRYFVTVAEELHFGRAAARLHISQPPLSQQIRALERELGVDLFWRTKRRVELTEAGAVLLDEARRTLRQAELAAGAARRAHRGEVGYLRVGFVDSAIYDYLPRLLAGHRRRYPDVHIQLVELPGGDALQAVSDDRVQVSFVRLPLPADTAIDHIVIGRDEIVALLPPGHALAERSSLDLSDLVGHPLILASRPVAPTVYDEILLRHRARGQAPTIYQEANSLRIIIAMVASGYGIGFGPEGLTSLIAPSIIERPIRPHPMFTEMAICWRPDDRSQLLRAFLATAREELAPSSALTRPAPGHRPARTLP